MPEYPSNFTPASGGLVLSPPAAVRTDKPALLLSVGNGNLIPLQTDPFGMLRVTEDGGAPTYFGTSQFACDSTGTDIATLAGNAACVAHLLWIAISSTATAAATGDFSVIRRSAANTAGTSGNASVAKADTGDGAANLQPVHYTAHPTGLGTSAGTLYGQRYIQPAASTTLLPGFFIDFRQFTGGKGLRIGASATDIIALNIAAALGGAGNAWDIVWCWTELPTTA